MNDQLKEPYVPEFEDNTSRRDPLKELEEWVNNKRLSAEIMNMGMWRSFDMHQDNEWTKKFCREVLAKIGEMRKPPSP